LFNVSNPLSPFLEVVVEEGKVVDVEEKVETKESVEESKPTKTIEDKMQAVNSNTQIKVNGVKIKVKIIVVGGWKLRRGVK
jgi:hypothetical protein